MVEAIQRSSLTQSIHLNVDSSQQGASSSGILPQGSDSISQPGEAEKTTGGRGSPVVRNLPLLFTEVTSLGASSSGTPPQGAGGSSKPIDEGGLQYAAFKVDRLRLAKTKCTEVPRISLKPGTAKVVPAVHGTAQVQEGPDQGDYKAQV
jgi:hypothetical protein